MLRDEFGRDAPGSLVNIADGVAFLPDLLPASLPLSQPLLLACTAADRAIGTLDGHSDELTNELLIQRPLMTREALKSTRIEGTYALAAGVLHQFATGPPSDESTALDNLEVIRYLEALEQGRRWIDNDRNVGHHMVRGLHDILLDGTRGAERGPGQYREVQVFIGSPDDNPDSARFVPPPPEHVAALMDNLFAYSDSNTGWPGLIDAAVIHYQFETIHPFRDGNGRLGRLMIPLLLMSKGALSRPLLYLSDYLDGHHEEYFDRLKAVSCQGDWEGWVAFFLQAVEATARDAVTRIRKITSLYNKYRTTVREGSRSQAPLAAIDLVMDKIFVDAAAVAEYANCSAPTAYAALETLSKLGVVEPHGDSYPALWVASELLSEAYEG